MYVSSLPLVADSLYFETVHMITEDWPLGDSEKVFKAGESLVMVCQGVCYCGNRVSFVASMASVIVVKVHELLLDMAAIMM